MTKRKALVNLMAPDLCERFLPSQIAAMRILVGSSRIRKTKKFKPVSLKSCGDLRHVSEVGTE